MILTLQFDEPRRRTAAYFPWREDERNGKIERSLKVNQYCKAYAQDMSRERMLVRPVFPMKRLRYR